MPLWGRPWIASPWWVSSWQVPAPVPESTTNGVFRYGYGETKSPWIELALRVSCDGDPNQRPIDQRRKQNICKRSSGRRNQMEERRVLDGAARLQNRQIIWRAQSLIFFVKLGLLILTHLSLAEAKKCKQFYVADGDKLSRFDLKKVRNIGKLDKSVEGFAVDAKAGILYGVYDSELYVMDDEGKAQKTVTLAKDDFYSLAVDKKGELYGLKGTSSQQGGREYDDKELYRIDTETGDVEFILNSDVWWGVYADEHYMELLTDQAGNLYAFELMAWESYSYGDRLDGYITKIKNGELERDQFTKDYPTWGIWDPGFTMNGKKFYFVANNNLYQVKWQKSGFKLKRKKVGVSGSSGGLFCPKLS